MKNYTREEITSLIKRFESKELPKVEWTHEAHLVVAVWYCSKHPIEKALNLVREYISRHNESVGTENNDTGGYHETITKFWLLVAQDYLKSSGNKCVEYNCNALINSEFGKSKFPFDYYSSELLFSAKARFNWIHPDLKKFE